MLELVLFGDSITYGYGVDYSQSWAAMVAKQLAALPNPVSVINAGINGETSADALHRIYQDVLRHHADAVYVQFGLNDASYDYNPKRTYVSLANYKTNMQTIVEKCFANGCKQVFLATNHPVGNSPYDMDEYPQIVPQYNEAVREVANTTSALGELIFIDLERGITGDKKLRLQDLLNSDGVHLSPAGNRYYAKVLGAIFCSRLSEVKHS